MELGIIPVNMQIQMFGGLRVQVGDEIASRIPTRHGEAILVMLALAPGHRVTRDEISDNLWPDEALDVSRRRIREHLYRLRRAIPDGHKLLVTEGDSLLLLPESSVWVDVHEFESFVERVEIAASSDGKAKLLQQADALYSGPLAPSLDWHRFDGLRTYYANIHVESLRALSRLFVERDFGRAIDYARRAVAADPLCDGAREELIRLYAQAGKPEDARRQYRELEKMLKREFDTEPSREITQFIKNISGAGTGGPIPRLLASLHIAMPNRRAARVYGVVAALSLVLVLVTLIAAKPWSRPPSPPLTAEQRIIHVQQLHAKIAAASSPAERDMFQKEQAEECIVLAEGAWKAWWGPDEEIWVNRLGVIDDQIEESLAWLKQNKPEKELQLSGALARYWVFPEERIKPEAHWLHEVNRFNGLVDDCIRARALVGLSRYYLTYEYTQARPGLEAALEAYRLYKKTNDVWGQAHALRYVALHRHHQRRNTEAIRDFRVALSLFKGLNDEWGQAQTYECMTYVDPVDTGGTASVAERLEWAITASRLYRKIKNPLGYEDGPKTLVATARYTLLTAATRNWLEAVERECREWLKLAVTHNDLPHQRILWITLAETALKLHDDHLKAEALLGLLDTAPLQHPSSEYHWRIRGAYIHYQYLDPHRQKRPDPLSWSIASRAMSRSEFAPLKTNFEFGGRMKLDEALRYAMEN